MCGIAQTLASIDGGKYNVTQGSAVQLQMSESDFATLAKSTNVRITAVDTEPSDQRWRFGIDTDTLRHQVSIHAPLSAPPGDYHVRIESRDLKRSTNSAEITVTVEQVAFPPGEIPVVFLNGFQVPSGTDTCPTLDVSKTFGILPGLLLGIQSPWAFFDNCKECPDCSIEDLGAKLANVLNSLHYADNTSVPMFDVITHSMGGLIVRSYLSGKLGVAQPGAFVPPVAPKIRKAIFISPPEFGSFLAPNAITSLQGDEMSQGSQFLWDLATWNDFGDDLRGVDAIDIVGNAGTDLNPGDSDGVVDVTSAVGILFPAERVRVVPYCHIDPGTLNAWYVTLGLSVTSGRPAAALCDPNSLPIAEVMDANHETWQIIGSFLTNSDDWQTIGTDPGNSPVLSNYLGLCLSWRDANGIPLLISSASLYNGATELAAGPSTFFCNSFVPPGTSQFQVVLSDGTQLTSGSLGLSNVGTYSDWLVKPGPLALHVTSDLYGGPGFGIASGSAITITGVSLTDSSGYVAVSANGSPLTISAASLTQVRAELPSSFSGLVKLIVSNSDGSDSINILTTPAASVPSMALSNSELAFGYALGGSPPQAQAITVSNVGGGTLLWAARSNVSWVIIASSDHSFTVSINPSGFAPKVYTGTVSVTAVGAGGSPQTVTVTLNVTAGASSGVVVTAVANSGSGAGGAISPGELITIYGTGLGPAEGVSFTVDPSTGAVGSTLGGTQVLFGNLAAPVTYASSGQVNAVVPFEIAGESQIAMQVRYQGVKSAGATLAVARAAPGAFTVSGSGSGQATATNRDGSANGPSNPAAAGSYVTIYFTGGGQTNPPSVTGSITGSVLESLVQNISVTVGGQPAAVSFAGAAPGLVAGVGQLNIQLASNTPAGPAEPLIMIVGGVTSPATATLAVTGTSGSTAVSITEHPLPESSSYPFGIAAGPDGALWFTEPSGNRVGRITTGGGITEYPVPTSNGFDPVWIAAGPDGALWFTETNGNKIGRIATDGGVSEYPVPTSSSHPYQITAGSDGALWFTENGDVGVGEALVGKIGRITTAGAITEYDVPTASGSPWGIAAGPDGALWFTESLGNKVGRISTAGTVTEYAVPTSSSYPDGIVSGPDGALWFTEYFGNKIGRITTAGAITEYDVPTSPGGPDPIAAGPDGALWFTEITSYKLARITTAGIITEYSLPTTSSRYGIAAGPDGAFWFTEAQANNIGRAALIAIAPTTPTLQSLILSSPSVAGGSSVTGTVTLTGPAPAGGLQISIQDSPAILQVSSPIPIPAGQSTATFTITAPAVASPTTVTITATLPGSSRVSASLIINPATAVSPLQNSSFGINGTLNISGQSVPVEIQTLAPSDEAFATLSDTGGSVIEIMMLFDQQVSISGNTLTYSGVDPASAYLNISTGAFYTSFTAATLTLTVPSATVGATVTGVLTFTSSGTTLSGTFTGTISEVSGP
jgi:uncharacterized protein (TIGR03437 family)